MRTAATFAYAVEHRRATENATFLRKCLIHNSRNGIAESLSIGAVIRPYTGLWGARKMLQENHHFHNSELHERTTRAHRSCRAPILFWSGHVCCGINLFTFRRNVTFVHFVFCLMPACFIAWFSVTRGMFPAEMARRTHHNQFIHSSFPIFIWHFCSCRAFGINSKVCASTRHHVQCDKMCLRSYFIVNGRNAETRKALA